MSRYATYGFVWRWRLGLMTGWRVGGAFRVDQLEKKPRDLTTRNTVKIFAAPSAATASPTSFPFWPTLFIVTDTDRH